MSREIQWLWPTPIMHYNLRESGRVDAGLHDALQAFSERNQGRLLNDEKRSATLETLYTRYDTGIFKRTRNPQLKAIRQLILEECDDYAAQVYGDQVRQARRDHTMWFVVQRSGINGLAKGAFELYRGYKLPEGIYRDSRGVYGYMLRPGSRYDKAEFDFSNDVFVSRVRETRLGYLSETRELESVVARLRSEGASSEYKENRVVWQRNSQKLESRSSMTESEVRSLEVENMVRYHDPVGSTPQELFRKSRSWEDVISSSMRKDPALNKILGIDGVLRGW
ncbi:hypothetical protein [Achromobacter ruhlandii]|uniref:hypothetical protein n=1 Tax=Achromobacter ruhlandii TaxID=72557 RepID=UPI001EEF5128|nr:hypothetical protein [Achromobacter ruhlandii]MCZ8398160.1 hypothetical protein [Achromobacter ruhlandii]